jgi:hypothetical protein
MDENKTNKQRESEEMRKLNAENAKSKGITKAHLLPTEILTVLSQEETLNAIVVIFVIARNRRRIGRGIRFEGHVERLGIIIAKRRGVLHIMQTGRRDVEKVGKIG